jgi:ferredoxin
MSTLVIKRVWIERSECTGHGLCVPEAAGLVEYNPLGDFSIVKLGRLTYAHQQLKTLLEASMVCPMTAFGLESEDGRVYTLPEDEPVRVALKSGNYR